MAPGDCFDLFEMFFEEKNLHLLPASSVRQHRNPPWKKRPDRKFFSLNPATGPGAIELIRIVEVSGGEKSLLLTFKQTNQNSFSAAVSLFSRENCLATIAMSLLSLDIPVVEIVVATGLSAEKIGSIRQG